MSLMLCKGANCCADHLRLLVVLLRLHVIKYYHVHVHKLHQVKGICVCPFSEVENVQDAENPPLSRQLLPLTCVFCVGAAAPYYVPHCVLVCVSV